MVFGGRFLLSGMFVGLLSFPANADLLITGVFDGDLSGGLPKGIELYALADIGDLSTYGIGSANNGDGSDGEEFSLTGSASAGDFIYVASESAQFQAFFGMTPTFVSSAANINGDDAMELFRNGAVIDLYGDPNTDGNGEVWEYTDGWAYRNNDTIADGSFSSGNYTFALSGLENESTNASAANPFPIGTFQVSAVPEPTTFALAAIGGLAGFAQFRRRRKAIAARRRYVPEKPPAHASIG